jgi:hypothetical protein
MPITKPLMPFDSPMIDEVDPVDAIEIEISEDTTSTPTEDGGIVIQFGPEEEDENVDVAHGDNLAEFIEDSDLEGMASELIDDFINDRNSRKDCPASGPARSKIVGKMTAKKLKQAQRVETELNYLLTEKMPDYRSELEQMLFRLPLAGSAFKKVYFDPIREVPVASFIPAEDLVVSYGASSLETCPRFTHLISVFQAKRSRTSKTSTMTLKDLTTHRLMMVATPSLRCTLTSICQRALTILMASHGPTSSPSIRVLWQSFRSAVTGVKMMRRSASGCT